MGGSNKGSRVIDDFKKPDFADALRVSHRQDLFLFDLGYVGEAMGVIYTHRFATTPKSLENFIKTLRERLEDYENEYKAIKLDSMDKAKKLMEERTGKPFEQPKMFESFGEPNFVDTIRVFNTEELFMIDFGFVNRKQDKTEEVVYTHRFVCTPITYRIFLDTFEKNMEIYREDFEKDYS